MTSPPSPTTPPPLPSQVEEEEDLSLAISPSKALAHQRTTTAWSRINTWLTTLLSPAQAVPSFERNTATLAHFQQLMDANIRADVRQRPLHEARVEQLRMYDEHDDAATQQSPARVLLRELKAALSQDSKTDLEAMARTSVTLGCMPPPLPEPTSEGSDDDDATTIIGKKIIELTQELFRLQNEVEELSQRRQRFDAERKMTEVEAAKLREEPRAVDDDDDDLDPHATLPDSNSAVARLPLNILLAQTSQFNTSTKQLTLKIKEYRGRIDGLSRTLELQRQHEGDITIEDVQRRVEAVQQKQGDVKELEARLSMYHGLPPVLEASREEVWRAQGELEEWRRRREAAFEGIRGA